MGFSRLLPFVALPLLLAGCIGARSSPAKDAPAERKESEPRLARDEVKWAVDADVAKVVTEPRDTTVLDLLKIERPKDLADDNTSLPFQAKRIPPLETSVWRVAVTIQSIVRREDGDLYLVLKDEKGNTIVSESPNLEECEKSPLYRQIAGARQALEERFHPTTEPIEADQKAVLTGLGFFGRATNKEGAYHSGARLMPLLKVEFS